MIGTDHRHVPATGTQKSITLNQIILIKKLESYWKAFGKSKRAAIDAVSVGATFVGLIPLNKQEILISGIVKHN